MTDTNFLVSMPVTPFSTPRAFKSVANGKIYIANPDTDPVNPANQIPVYVVNEDGSEVQVSQPIIINAGGFPVYNGQPMKFVAKQSFSMAVYDMYFTQQYYWPSIEIVDPKDTISIINSLSERVDSIDEFTKNGIRYVTPEMFIDLVVNGDWSDAIEAADEKAVSMGLPLYGFNTKYEISRTVNISSEYVMGLKLYPSSGFSGGGAIFTVNQSSGMININVGFYNFIAYGAKVLRGGFTGTPSIILDSCDFINNGRLLRTTCVSAVNTSTDFVISVTSSSGFSPNDYVWIGDSKCRILSISGNSITLYNNGSSPTLFPGGTGTGTYSAGQFFTKDGDGRNGLTVGNADASWNVQTIGKNTFNDNGWFGLFCYSSSESGRLTIKDADANNNGYCGLGCGYVGEGEIVNNTTIGNGNNGIDIFQTSNKLKISKNRSSNNGVDGIFAGASGTGPVISENYCSNNKRIGILAYGRGSAPSGYNLIDNYCVGNELNSICLTGVYAAKVSRNTMGASSQALKIEGKNGLLNPQGIIVSNNDFIDASVSRDIFANIGGYTSGGDAGSIKIIDNNYFGRRPSITCTGYSTTKSKFSPRGYMAFTSPLTAAIGASISVSLTFAKMNETTIVDPTAGVVEMQFSNSSSFISTDTPSSATRTAGIEISNTATTNGRILSMANAGSLSYNVSSTTARTLYLMVKSEYGDGVIQLTWS
ncbi:TPA: right-handed parallel beta-helix repeat-containing protein [Klebsiella aerogenes]|nr:right-handed parallel beta-helix repeat-containing protein [Klebsiella aerogenes]